MNDGEIISAVNNILAEKTQKFNDGIQGKAEVQYNGCVAALESILSTNETSNSTSSIEDAIAEFRLHMQLGIVINGKWQEINPAIAARFNLREGNYLGNRFLLLHKDAASILLRNPDKYIYPNYAIWDSKTNSVLHLAFYYRRYLDEILGISEEEAKELGLLDEYNQQLAYLD